MGYQSFERKEGDVLRRVEAVCQHLTTKGSFTDTSPVCLAHVEMYIDNSFYWVQAQLARHGFSLAVTNDNVKGVLQEIQALDAAQQVEFSVPVTASGEPNERFKGLIARVTSLISGYFETDALEQLGQQRDRPRSKYLELTGRSRDRKRDVYAASDVVQPRFPRGFGQRGDIPDRSGVETGGGADPNQL